MEKYSVLMPLYKGDVPEWFVVSIDSMINQTIKPDEIVIVCDGELTDELEVLLEKYRMQYEGLFQVYRFEENVGLGRVLATGVEMCHNDLIARMDADDYSIPSRCEQQLKCFSKNPELDMIGCNVEEFKDDFSNVMSHVLLPETHDEIVKFARKRSPIRHPAMMYRKSAVLLAGNYRDYRRAQDYSLIVNMIMSGAKLYNIQENLVYMRVSPDFYKRRGGIKLAKLNLKLKKEFWDCGFYSFSDFIISGIGNFVVCILPNKLRKIIYCKILR